MLNGLVKLIWDGVFILILKQRTFFFDKRTNISTNYLILPYFLTFYINFFSKVTTFATQSAFYCSLYRNLRFILIAIPFAVMFYYIIKLLISGRNTLALLLGIYFVYSAVVNPVLTYITITIGKFIFGGFKDYFTPV